MAILSFRLGFHSTFVKTVATKIRIGCIHPRNTCEVVGHQKRHGAEGKKCLFGSVRVFRVTLADTGGSVLTDFYRAARLSVPGR